jgi:hypothetical protein
MVTTEVPNRRPLQNILWIAVLSTAGRDHPRLSVWQICEKWQPDTRASFLVNRSLLRLEKMPETFTLQDHVLILKTGLTGRFCLPRPESALAALILNPPGCLTVADFSEVTLSGG